MYPTYTLKCEKLQILKTSTIIAVVKVEFAGIKQGARLEFSLDTPVLLRTV